MKVRNLLLAGLAAVAMTACSNENDETVDMELSTLNLSYEFGMPWMKKVGLKRLKVLFYMNDVFRASTVKQERGIDYPFARNFSVGLQARF